MTEPWLDAALRGASAAEDMRRLFPWADAMAACPQDAVYHAEGDVWTHTVMVAEALEVGLVADKADLQRDALRVGAWFHDVAKPTTTIIEFDETLGRERVRQPGHAPLGAQIAWQALIDAGAGAPLARAVHDLVFWHQRPAHMLSQKNSLLRSVQFSVAGGNLRWSDLLDFCSADNRGRISPNLDETLMEFDLLQLYIGEAGLQAGCDLVREPWPFATENARMRYLNGPADGNAFWTPPEPAGSRLVMMSGLPGAGKNTLIAETYPDLPVVAMDDVRRDLGLAPGDNEGRVAQAALEAARVHLRSGQDFVWNATAINRLMRQKVTRLGLDYDARVEIHQVDVPCAVALARNAKRKDPVPDAIIRGMAAKREPATLSEAHTIWSTDQHGITQRISPEHHARQVPDDAPHSP